MKTPLAWKNLTHDRKRFLMAFAGIGFAVLLMCMQLGFRNALFDSTVALIRQLNADLIITSRAQYTLVVRETFTRRRLDQAMTWTGGSVESAWPLYFETQRSLWRAHGTADAHLVRVLAFDPSEPVFLSPEVRDQSKRLGLTGQVLFDRKSKDYYGDLRTGATADLAGEEIRVAGHFDLGTDFSYDGNLMMSDRDYQLLFGRPGAAGDGLAAVDLGLLKLAPGNDLETVRDMLTRAFAEMDDVKVQTRKEFEEQELAFWRKSTPIGMVFQVGVAMGFVVGVIICYQILYSDINDHMAEFATLKAMGYPAGYFIKVVLQEAFWLSIFGFLPGVGASWLLYQALAATTGLPLELTWSLAGLVFALTVGMCVVSGCLSMRKVLAADPAELFR